jgi:predicted lipoprotein with Yx(FWY)xxD motif
VRPRPPAPDGVRRAGVLLAGAVVAGAGVAGLGGCGGHGTPPAGEPTLQVEYEPGWGPLLTDPSGSPLYLDTRDARGRPTCVGACATEWIPLIVPDGASAQAGVGVSGRLIGTVARPGGGRQITYGGWPLYSFLGDRTTFSVTGNGRHAGGGTFHPVTAAGRAAERRR